MINSLPKSSTKKDYYYYYGSVLRDNAMILEAMGLLNMQQEGMNLLRSVAEGLSEDRWMSTQTTAYGLLGVIKFVGLNGSAFGNSLQAEYTVSGGRKETLNTAKPIKVAELANDQQSGQVNVKNNGQSILFVRVIQRGQPLTGNETSGSSGLRLQVNYFDRNNVPIDPSNLAQELTLQLRSQFTAPAVRVYRDLALSQIFPSGWEILNDRLNEIPVLQLQITIPTEISGTTGSTLIST